MRMKMFESKCKTELQKQIEKKGEMALHNQIETECFGDEAEWDFPT